MYNYCLRVALLKGKLKKVLRKRATFGLSWPKSRVKSDLVGGHAHLVRFESTGCQI